MEELLRTENLTRIFHVGSEDIYAVNQANIKIRKGGLTIFEGPSGSGKTTLINILGSLDQPTEGKVYYRDMNITDWPEQKRDGLRRDKIGFIFQSIALITLMSAYENVDYGLRIAGVEPDERDKRVRNCLSLVGLGDRMDHRPQELSGGEQQRVAIARAIAHQPDIIIADEPTSDLDSHTGLQVIKLFKELVDEQGVSIIMTSHDPNIIGLGDQIFQCRDGEVEEVGKMIFCENLMKIYKTGDLEVIALQGLDLTIEKGEMVAIIGNSGSGKSTLLNMVGGLDKPSAGTVEVNGDDLTRYTSDDLLDYRRETIGFVWQNNARNLIPFLTAVQNVELPMQFTNKQDRSRKAKELLDMVGLSHRYNSKLNQLSGGEIQRVAIAIALSNDPKLLLADEPTGSLDTKTTIEVLKVFRRINKDLGITIMIVTHDPRLARSVDRVVSIRDGRCSSEFLRREVLEDEWEHLDDSFSEAVDEEMETHDELIVVDKAGRLQVPHAYWEALGIEGKDRVLVRQEEGKIIIESAVKAETDSFEPEE
jgi:ABC-type lipoprotein export system ATPase subunit